MSWLMQLLVGLALNILAYLLMPRPKRKEQKPKDMEAPTVEAGKPVPVAMGTVVIGDPMIIDVGVPIKRKRRSKPLGSMKK